MAGLLAGSLSMVNGALGYFSCSAFTTGVPLDVLSSSLQI
jgi:hypothetical protein